MQDSVLLSGKQLAFIMSKYETDDPDQAVEKLIEELVSKGLEPMLMKTHIDKMMIRENN